MKPNQQPKSLADLERECDFATLNFLEIACACIELSRDPNVSTGELQRMRRERDERQYEFGKARIAFLEAKLGFPPRNTQS